MCTTFTLIRILGRNYNIEVVIIVDLSNFDHRYNATK